MTNPEKILLELDKNLQNPVELILYGRAALSLAFLDGGDWAATMDVDVIIPNLSVAAFDQNLDFWKALEQTNSALESEGLYLTHVFLEEQVILSKEWRTRCVPIVMEGLKNLTVHRPSTEDLILTKMMRVDPQDREDILNLHQYVSQDIEWKSFFTSAVVPDIPEIQEAFFKNQEWFVEKVLK